MKEESLRTIINHITSCDTYEELKFGEKDNTDYIIAILNNGERLRGLCGYAEISYGLLRLCDAKNMSDKAQENAKWYCVPAEEVRYIESSIAIPRTGYFSVRDTLNYDERR